MGSLSEQGAAITDCFHCHRAAIYTWNGRRMCGGHLSQHTVVPHRPKKSKRGLGR